MPEYLVEVLILFGCVALAGGVVLAMKRPLHGKTGFLLSFSGAFLMGFCFMHLLPFVFNSDLNNPGAWIVGGFLIQILFELLSGGVEHGHFHAHTQTHAQQRFPFAMMIGLCLHAFFEGMPFGTHEHAHNHGLLLGIVMHKVPVALVLGGMFLSAGYTKLKSMFWLLVFASMSPLGAISYTFLEMLPFVDGPKLAVASTGLLVGILLHVATTILFESSDGHKLNVAKFITILIGLSLAYFSG
jgi:zinc and cadmium transporter